jgi:hypothetical protein
MEEVEQLKASISHDLNDIKLQSKIRYFPNFNAPARTSNCNSIHFVPQNADERDQFIELLSDELLLRNLSPRGELEELRQHLLQEIMLEHKLQQHLENLLHCDKLVQCIIALLHKIPCILHCENRVGTKILTMLLLEGFSNAQQGTIFSNVRSEAECIQLYAERIQILFNNTILGDDDGPAQWALPMNEEVTNVGIICLDNNRIRKALHSFELLIEVSSIDLQRVIKCNYCIPHYRQGMELLRQRKEFTDEEIKQYQHHVDNWYQVWVELHGIHGCTNYTHVLSSGHLAEYIFKWRNLYRFSQQGWENFNHVFTTVYFRRKNHGGRRHEGAIKSKLIGIARWLQRRLLWMTGLGDKILNEANETDGTVFNVDEETQVEDDIYE